MFNKRLKRKYKQGFSLLELVIVSIIAGILLSIYINIAGKQIEEGEKYAIIKFMDRINYKVCPAYISSFSSNNDLTNDKKILKHNFDLNYLFNKYSIKIPERLNKYITSYKLTYKNFNCILEFDMKSKKLPLVKTVSGAKIEPNGDTTHITFFYPVSTETLLRNLSIVNVFNGKSPPGTFADYWKEGETTQTNIGTLRQYNNSSLYNYNRISSYNWNKHDYESLSYHGSHIPDNMAIIH